DYYIDFIAYRLFRAGAIAATSERRTSGEPHEQQVSPVHSEENNAFESCDSPAADGEHEQHQGRPEHYPHISVRDFRRNRDRFDYCSDAQDSEYIVNVAADDIAECNVRLPAKGSEHGRRQFRERGADRNDRQPEYGLGNAEMSAYR